MAEHTDNIVMVPASMAQEITDRLNQMSGEVSEIKGSQTALQRDIHHLSGQLKDIVISQKEMAHAVVKLARVSERMDRAVQDINGLAEKSRAMGKEIEKIKEEQAAKDHEHDRRIDAVESFVKWLKWILGGGLLAVIGIILKKIAG